MYKGFSGSGKTTILDDFEKALQRNIIRTLKNLLERNIYK